MGKAIYMTGIAMFVLGLLSQVFMGTRGQEDTPDAWLWALGAMSALGLLLFLLGVIASRYQRPR